MVATTSGVMVAAFAVPMLGVSAARDDDSHLPTHEIAGEPRQSIVLALSPTIVEGDVLSEARPAKP
jgi:hypothetical protein